MNPDRAYVHRLSGLDRRGPLIFFCEGDPADVWQREFAGQANAVKASGLGTYCDEA